MKHLAVISAVLVLASGCCCEVNWNKFRLGHINDTTVQDGQGNEVRVERTLGIHLQWAPDL